MKTNHDGTVTLNAYDTWSCCNTTLRELSDEEIIKEIKLLPQIISMEDKDFIRFARAILKKASEK